jgi:hypothetical protein
MSDLGRRFRYIQDPVFVVCVVLYATNRWLLKPFLSPTETFLRGHFNDILLIPCALPPVLLLHRVFRLRRSDCPPTAFEVLLHLIVWSIVCEWIGPHFVKAATGDPVDVLAYCVGAVVSWLVWNRLDRQLGRVGSAMRRPTSR